MNFREGIFRLRVTGLVLILLFFGALAWDDHNSNSVSLDKKITEFEDAISSKFEDHELPSNDPLYNAAEARLAKFKAEKRQSLLAAIFVPPIIGLVYWLLGSWVGWIGQGFRSSSKKN